MESLPALLDEVDEDPDDKEYAGVSVVRTSGWATGVYSRWIVTLGNVEDLDIEPRHIVAGTDRRLVLGLMRAAAVSDLAGLKRNPGAPDIGRRDTEVGSSLA